MNEIFVVAIWWCVAASVTLVFWHALVGNHDDQPKP